MAGLHESAAGDTPMDRKLRILKYFLRSTALEEDKVFLKGLIRHYNMYKQDCYTMALVSIVILIFLLNFHIANNITFQGSKS